MKISDFNVLQQEMAKDCLATAAGKGKDYASQEDTFQSFKIGSAIAALLKLDMCTPRGDALCVIVRKLVRLCNLEHKGIITPVYEPIKDTVRDLHVYLDLYYGMLLEERGLSVDSESFSK